MGIQDSESMWQEEGDPFCRKRQGLTCGCCPVGYPSSSWHAPMLQIGSLILINYLIFPCLSFLVWKMRILNNFKYCDFNCDC